MPLALLVGALVAFVPPLVAQSEPASPMVTFDHKTGNEWWVEVGVSGPMASQLSGVQAMDTGGPWVSLAKKSWGAWAASFHIEPGHQVRFRALFPDGGSVASCWFSHPAGIEDCGSSSSSSSSSSSTTGSGGFDATFSGVKGNAWWVEAKVSANQPLAGVDARLDCAGAWRPLTLKDWGAWAASFNIPAGSKVDLRARSTTGATDLSGGYIWTAATPTAPCGDGGSSPSSSSSSSSTSTGPPAFDATFTGVKGNAYWIQTSVGATGGTVSKVDVRLDNGAYRPLTKQSWGGWTASYSAPAGSLVQFRATSSSGATDLSGCYLWTAATPTACPEPWPREGSTVRYEMQEGIQDSSYPNFMLRHTNLTGTYTDGSWRVVCEVHYQEYDYTTNEVESDSHLTQEADRSVPLVSTATPVGGLTSAVLPRVCGGESVDLQRESDIHQAVVKDGKVVTVKARDFREAGAQYTGFDVAVHTDRFQGLVLSWELSDVDYECECYARYAMGRLVETDAPVGPVVSRAEQKAAQPAWPVEGSHVVYFGDSWSATGWHNTTYVSLDYSESEGWQGICQVTTYEPDEPEYAPVTTTTRPVALTPLTGPTPVADAAFATVPVLRECAVVSDGFRMWHSVAEETMALTDDGETRTVEAYWGDETPDEAGDEDVYWDAETGLVLRWEIAPAGTDAHFEGLLVSTDAPLR